MCGGIGISHLSYASSTGEAASFVVKAIGTVGSDTSGTTASGLAGIIAKGKGSDNSGTTASGLAGLIAKGKGSGKGNEAKGSNDNEAKGSKDTDKIAKGSKGIFGKGKNGKDSGNAKDAKSAKRQNKNTSMRFEGSYDMPHFIVDSK